MDSGGLRSFEAGKHHYSAVIRPVRAAGNKVPLLLRTVSHEGRADSRFITTLLNAPRTARRAQLAGDLPNRKSGNSKGSPKKMMMRI